MPDKAVEKVAFSQAVFDGGGQNAKKLKKRTKITITLKRTKIITSLIRIMSTIETKLHKLIKRIRSTHSYIILKHTNEAFTNKKIKVQY